ncbi:DUF4214 domain-containing protein [Acanthopleuribacter pedis]|uniref:DUF4214 domain-containing protein n=1 Tax=Acanthopleuribacter pedis TaxID=442870 RepID=A0A8J7QEE8_9BACT|nr:DUF4214 domain-containing protein [Acanthopleuribacter pedis]MBO1323082.1 DUF4214 domain-containing protein [Acanthopleuribacter pedis]
MKKALMTLALLSFFGTALAVDPPPYYLINPHDGETCYEPGDPALGYLKDPAVTTMIANMMEASWGMVFGPSLSDYWFRLVTQDMTMEEVALDIIRHPRFINPSFDRFVGNTYHALLLREPDCGGFEWWLNNHNDRDYEAVVKGFTWSNEFGSLAEDLRIKAHR